MTSPPIPAAPISSSTESSPTKPREMALRTPLAMNGIAHGPTTLRKIGTRPPPKDRAARTSEASTVCTPSLQLRHSGTAADRTTIQMLVVVLNPEIRMSSGAKAMLGRAKKPHR